MNDIFDISFFQRLINQVDSHIYITDVETDKIVFMNDTMKRAYGLQDVEGRLCYEVLVPGQTERCPFCKIPHLLKTGDAQQIWRFKSPLNNRLYLNQDRVERWNGRTWHIQHSTDVTDQVKLSIEASFDALTGILNRSAGRQQLDSVVARLREGDLITVALLDVNNLKYANDTYGHSEGDKLLYYIARTIWGELEDEEFICRLSGDEFFVAFPHKDIAETDEWMRNILKMLDERREENHIQYEVSFCYGLARLYAGDGMTASDLLAVADTQMYIQKREYHASRVSMGHDSRQVKQDTPSFRYTDAQLFDALAAVSDEYIFVGDITRDEFLFSRKMAMDFGLPNRVLTNALESWAERVHPDDRESFLRSNYELVDGKTDSYTISYRAKDTMGNWVHLLCRGCVCQNASGAPQLFVGTLRDMGREKAAAQSKSSVGYSFLDEKINELFSRPEHALTAASGSQRQALHFLSGAEPGQQFMTELQLLHFVNENLPLMCISQTVLDLTGYSYEEICDGLGGSYERLIHPDDRIRMGEEVRRQLGVRDLYKVEYRMVRKDGSSFWVQDRGRYVTDRKGRRLFLCFTMDITQETELAQNLMTIVDNSINGVYKAAIRDGFPLLHANNGYYLLHGYTEQQMQAEVGNRILDLILPEDAAQMTKEVDAYLKGEPYQTVMEYRIRKRDGSIAWLRGDVNFKPDANGEVVAMGMVTDITKRKEAEMSLRRTSKLYHVAQKYSRLSMWELDIRNRKIYQTPESKQLHGL